MKKLSALALIAALFAFATPHTVAEAKMKLRLHNNHDNHGVDRISCNTARHMVRERGYSVRVKSCISNVYSFYAVRNGRTYIFYVDSFTRSLWQKG